MDCDIGLVIFDDYSKDFDAKRNYWISKSKESDYKQYEKEINHKILAYSKLLVSVKILIETHKADKK